MITREVAQFNKQGRTMSESMRLRAFLKDFPLQGKTSIKEEYRGFTLTGNAGKWFVADWPLIFTSKSKAKLQIDKCLQVRALMEGAQ